MSTLPTRSDSLIGIEPEHLLAAANAHMERTALFGPNPIGRILASVGVTEPDEFAALVQTLQDLRKVEGAKSKTAAYDGGVLDGFLLGVRALKIAQGGEA